jgi:hypothetical protein
MVLGHGGAGGALLEAAPAVAVVALAVVLWWRSRRAEPDE